MHFGVEPKCAGLAFAPGTLMRSPINVLKPQPVLVLIQYCLCLLQSIACNLGHGQRSCLHITAVIVQKPHKCDFAWFSCFHLSWKGPGFAVGWEKNLKRPGVDEALSKPTGRRRKHTVITLKPRLFSSELLKSWHFRSARFLPYSHDIVSCCWSLVCEWEHLVGEGECVCLWTAACSCTQWHKPTQSLPNLWYMKPLIQVPPVVPFNTGVQRAPRLATNGDPLPVLSPFNDWISSRLPSSRVIAWWSARCCARAGGGGGGALGSRDGVGLDKGEQK